MIVSKIRVLLYHSVSSDGHRDPLTVSKDQLEEHFRYLKAKGYSSISLSQLIAYHRHEEPLPPKPVLITFDEGFKNCFDLAYPLAKAYGMKINLFLVPAFMLRGTYINLPCMGINELSQMDPALVETALHSFMHQRYAELTPAQVEADIDICQRYLDGLGIRYQPCLAYPHGAYPGNDGVLQPWMSDILDQKGIQLAFGEGNCITGLPLRDPFLIGRYDVKGGDSFRTFRWRLRLISGKFLGHRGG